MVARGEIYWLRFRGEGSEPEGRHPALIVQADRFNRSTIQTVVAAMITSNLALADSPGNVRLRKREGGLPKASVVNVTQLRTYDKARFSERIGQLGQERMTQVMGGLALVFGWESQSSP